MVIRTHKKALLQLRSLIYSLRGQAGDWLKLDFVLVPTGPGSQETYRALKQGPLKCVDWSVDRSNRSMSESIDVSIGRSTHVYVCIHLLINLTPPLPKPNRAGGGLR